MSWFSSDSSNNDSNSSGSRADDYDRGYEDGKADSSKSGDDHPPFFFTDFGRADESTDHAPFFPW